MSRREKGFLPLLRRTGSGLPGSPRLNDMGHVALRKQPLASTVLGLVVTKGFLPELGSSATGRRSTGIPLPEK